LVLLWILLQALELLRTMNRCRYIMRRIARSYYQDALAAQRRQV
jgi:hypothetical protein